MVEVIVVGRSRQFTDAAKSKWYEVRWEVGSGVIQV